MFLHSVYFWLRPDLGEADRRAFVQGLHSLTQIDSVEHGFFGAPASTDRPIIDRTYSYALVVVFRDAAGHDAYQAHPVHDVFRETCAGFWSDIRIYDCVATPEAG